MTDFGKSGSGPGEKEPSFRGWVLPLILLAAILAFMLRNCSVPPPGKSYLGEGSAGVRLSQSPAANAALQPVHPIDRRAAAM